MKLALIQCLAMSFWGKADEPGDAVRTAFKQLKSCRSLNISKDARIMVGVYDHNPYSTIVWGNVTVGVREDNGKEEPINPEEYWVLNHKGDVLRILPGKPE